MTFADMVLVRATLEHLTVSQIERTLDALEGNEVELTEADRAALLQFVRTVRAEFGEVPAAAEIERLAMQRPRSQTDGKLQRSPEEHARLIEKSLSIGRDCAERLQRAQFPENPDDLLFDDLGRPHER